MTTRPTKKPAPPSVLPVGRAIPDQSSTDTQLDFVGDYSKGIER